MASRCGFVIQIVDLNAKRHYCQMKQETNLKWAKIWDLCYFILNLNLVIVCSTWNVLPR